MALVGGELSELFYRVHARAISGHGVILPEHMYPSKRAAAWHFMASKGSNSAAVPPHTTWCQVSSADTSWLPGPDETYWLRIIHSRYVPDPDLVQAARRVSREDVGCSQRQHAFGHIGDHFSSSNEPERIRDQVKPRVSRLALDVGE